MNEMLKLIVLMWSRLRECDVSRERSILMTEVEKLEAFIRYYMPKIEVDE